jgi:hypothetical protein
MVVGLASPAMLPAAAPNPRAAAEPLGANSATSSMESSPVAATAAHISFSSWDMSVPLGQLPLLAASSLRKGYCGSPRPCDFDGTLLSTDG